MRRARKEYEMDIGVRQSGMIDNERDGIGNGPERGPGMLTVRERGVKDMLVIDYINEGIEHLEQKPLLRLDKGSPNMACRTRRLIRELEILMSPSIVNRPTDNARQERWYRPVKQEEIYCHGDYPSLEITMHSMARYFDT